MSSQASGRPPEPVNQHILTHICNYELFDDQMTLSFLQNMTRPLLWKIEPPDFEWRRILMILRERFCCAYTESRRKSCCIILQVASRVLELLYKHIPPDSYIEKFPALYYPVILLNIMNLQCINKGTVIYEKMAMDNDFSFLYTKRWKLIWPIASLVAAMSV